MNDTEAMRVLSPLVAATGGWDDPKVELWVHKLGDLARVDWAAEAVDQIINTHTATGAPPWAKLYDTYQAIARRRAPAHRELDNPDAITHAEYLTRLRERAANGNTAAQAELDRWRQLAAAPRSYDGTPDWIAALA